MRSTKIDKWMISEELLKLDFGQWEQIFYFEFDGKRDKRVLVTIIGE